MKKFKNSYSYSYFTSLHSHSKIRILQKRSGSILPCVKSLLLLSLYSCLELVERLRTEFSMTYVGTLTNNRKAGVVTFEIVLFLMVRN
jgi:hypothetical protein